MNFYSILQEILTEKNLSVSEAARTCGIPDSTLRSIITRKNKTVALEVAMKISKGLSVSLERLNGMEDSDSSRKKSSSETLHPTEEKLISSFRSLNCTGKSYILQTMELAVMAYGNNPNPFQKQEEYPFTS